MLAAAPTAGSSTIGRSALQASRVITCVRKRSLREEPAKKRRLSSSLILRRLPAPAGMGCDDRTITRGAGRQGGERRVTTLPAKARSFCTVQSLRPVRTLTAAEALLVAACRGDVRGGSTADWLAALALAHHHQLSALLCAALRDAPAGDRPARPIAAWQALQHDEATARRRHQQACRELTAVLATLWDIPTLALKGPALAARLYPDGGRLYEDLDIAVRAQDYPIARAKLLKSGYRPPGR